MAKTKKYNQEDQLKLYSSPIYRRQVKKVVESIKKLRGISQDTKLPGKPNPLSGNATEKERDAYAKKNAFRVDRDSAHYWAQVSDESSRVQTSSAAPVHD